MNTRPLCTRNVWPTNSGGMVQARAQVFTGSRVRAAFCFSTLRNSLRSTNGPFLTLRLMLRAPDRSSSLLHVLAGLAPAQNHLVRPRLRPPGLAALGQLAPRAARVPAAAGAPLAATHRVRHRVL